MAEVIDHVVVTVMEEIKRGAEAMAEQIKVIAETAEKAKMADCRLPDYAGQIKHLNDYMAKLKKVDPDCVESGQLSGLKTDEGSESDSETLSDESGTETETGEQRSPVKKPCEQTLKSSNSTEVGPESPVPARMEGLVYMIYTPGKSINGVIIESEEIQLKREIEARKALRKSFEESLIKAEKLPEQPSGEGTEGNITTTESNGEHSKEQAHVEDVLQAKIDERNWFSLKSANSNIEIAAEKSLLKSDDSRDSIAISDETIDDKLKFVPVEPSPVKSKNSGPVISLEKSESSVCFAKELDSGDISCVNTPKDSVTQVSAETEAELRYLVCQLKLTKIGKRLPVEMKSVKESSTNLTESKIALNSESFDTETSAVIFPVDSSPKDQNELKPRKEPCKPRYTIIDYRLQAEE